MKPDVTINGVPMLSLGWLRETVNFPTPQSQSNTITVPGRNSPIRFSEALGRVAYQPRTFEMTFSMLGDRAEYDQLVSAVVNQFAGQLCQVIVSDVPELYAVGTLEAEPSYDPRMGKGTLILSCNDGDAYLYHVNETEIMLTGDGTATLENDYMPVVPTITVTEEATLRADIGDIRAGMYVKCISTPHGIYGTYRCMSRTRDYLNPAGNTITIGASGVRLTDLSTKQNGTIAALEENILGQNSKIEDISGKVDDLEETVSELGDVDGLKQEIRECYSEIEKNSEQIQSTVRENYLSKDDLTTIQQDFQTAITQSSSEIRMDFTNITNEITENMSSNFALIEEYIRFRGALIELGKVGNAFTAELSNESLSFKENGQEIAYISNQSLVITNAEIRNRLSLGTAARGWFDFIPRATGNLSIQWRDPTQ